ncbi:MAG: hypothetical protein ACJAZS_000019 [Alteromonas naphthalenivorans]|jgi:hypothetical protein
MNFKKISLFVLLSLSVQSVSSLNVKFNLPGPAFDVPNASPTVAGAMGVFLINNIGYQCAVTAQYLYFSREARLQESNPTINHDVIKALKKMCFDKKGVKIDRVYYGPQSPTVGIRGGAAVVKSPFGNLLILGSGYGASKNEKDILPITPEQVEFVMGHECNHVLTNDVNKRFLLDSAISTGIVMSNSVYNQEMAMAFSLYKMFGYSRFIRNQEFECDYSSSNDPKVIQAGIDLWQGLADKEQYLDIFTRINTKIQHAIFSTHPSFSKRLDYLKLRLKELEQKSTKETQAVPAA